MIKNFLIISCIGKDDKLGLRINKDFFVHKLNNYKNEKLVAEILSLLKRGKTETRSKFYRDR